MQRPPACLKMLAFHYRDSAQYVHMLPSLLMEILNLLLGIQCKIWQSCVNHSVIQAAEPMLHLTKIRCLHAHGSPSAASITMLLSAEGPILESKICLCKMLLSKTSCFTGKHSEIKEIDSLLQPCTQIPAGIPEGERVLCQVFSKYRTFLTRLYLPLEVY